MQRFGKKQHLNSRRDLKNQPGGREEDFNSSLRDLAEACKRGDRSAQRNLFDTLAPKMFPVCLRYMGDRETAEDILQEGFVTLFTRLDSYSGEGSFEGWARKIFVNTALMSLRRTDALKLSDSLETAWGVGSEGDSPVLAMGYKELLELISQLPAGFRTVFNLHVIEGYSHKEISKMLGISEATSRSQLQRARMLLQKRIKSS